MDSGKMFATNSCMLTISHPYIHTRPSQTPSLLAAAPAGEPSPAFPFGNPDFPSPLYAGSESLSGFAEPLPMDGLIQLLDPREIGFDDQGDPACHAPHPKSPKSHSSATSARMADGRLPKAFHKRKNAKVTRPQETDFVDLAGFIDEDATEGQEDSTSDDYFFDEETEDETRERLSAGDIQPPPPSMLRTASHEPTFGSLDTPTGLGILMKAAMSSPNGGNPYMDSLNDDIIMYGNDKPASQDLQDRSVHMSMKDISIGASVSDEQQPSAAPVMEDPKPQKYYEDDEEEILSVTSLAAVTQFEMQIPIVPTSAQFRLLAQPGRGVIWTHPQAPKMGARSNLSLPPLKPPSRPSSPPTLDDIKAQWAMHCRNQSRSPSPTRPAPAPTSRRPTTPPPRNRGGRKKSGGMIKGIAARAIKQKRQQEQNTQLKEWLVNKEEAAAILNASNEAKLKKTASSAPTRLLAACLPRGSFDLEASMAKKRKAEDSDEECSTDSDLCDTVNSGNKKRKITDSDGDASNESVSILAATEDSLTSNGLSSSTQEASGGSKKRKSDASHVKRKKTKSTTDIKDKDQSLFEFFPAAKVGSPRSRNGADGDEKSCDDLDNATTPTLEHTKSLKISTPPTASCSPSPPSSPTLSSSSSSSSSSDEESRVAIRAKAKANPKVHLRLRRRQLVTDLATNVYNLTSDIKVALIGRRVKRAGISMSEVLAEEAGAKGLGGSERRKLRDKRDKLVRRRKMLETVRTVDRLL
ncbi:hypothetical protein DFS34DRAFT_250646 [Phlyctochytrium arcticum]|nr:hypothetical protein DFS34DRAFT_250646 [Phlyctochytrium arcticum]